MELLQFIEKFQEVKEATKNISGTSPGKTSTSTANGSTSATVAAPTSMTNSTSASANASPVNSRSAMANAGLGSGATPSAFTNDDKEPAKQECECSALASGRSAPKSFFFSAPLSTFRSDALASWTRDFRPINERQGRSPSFSLSLSAITVPARLLSPFSSMSVKKNSNKKTRNFVVGSQCDSIRLHPFPSLIFSFLFGFWARYQSVKSRCSWLPLSYLDFELFSLYPSTFLDTTTDGNTSPVGAVSPALLKSALVTHQRSQSLSGLQVNWLDQVTVFTFFYMYNVNEGPSSLVG